MPSELLLSCRDVVDELVEQSTVVNLAHHLHVERCDNCRRAVASLRRLRDETRALRTLGVEVPPDLAALIGARLDDEDASPARRVARVVRVAPYLGGVVAATAAGAMLAGRRRLRTV